MSCPHAQSTTVAWLYGEGPEAHGAHVASCADCTDVLVEHESVLAAVAPVARQLSAEPPRAPARRSVLGWSAALGLLAAAALLFVLPRQAPTDAPEAVAVALDTDAVARHSPDLLTDALDSDLDALGAEVVLLSLDLSTL